MAGKKNNPNAKYAIAALVVALLACAATALLGSVKGVLALQMFTLDESALKTLNLIFNISVALALIGLGVYAILSPDAIRRFFSGRQARYGSNALVMTIAFLGIVFALNYLAYNNPNWLGAPWDLTEDKSNTLAPETLQTLASLPQKVEATAFYATLDQASAEELLLKFKNNSNGKFDYKFVNPDTNPLAAKEAGVTGDGKILLQMGDAKQVASYASEQEITKALIYVISPTPSHIYFLQGHGEAALTSSGQQLSVSTAKDTLEAKNYIVNELNLLTAKEIPADADLIVIAGPQKPLTKDEVKQLQAYVDAGGALFVMENPTLMTDFGGAPDPLNDYLNANWGIQLNNDVIIDYVNTQNPLQAVSSGIGAHPITQNLTANYVVILPQARSIAVTAEKENVTQTVLLTTTEQSWGETELTSGQQPQFDAAKDIQGPLNLAIAAENSVTKGRVVVFGNSIFASNDAFDAYGNGNIFVNSVDWAAAQEDRLNLSARESKPRTFLPPDTIQFIIIIIVAVFVLPGIVIVSGISAWIARRRKG
ncbi:MAG: hypothetical protein Fur002_17360 [Anaerolineales bacterium]